MDQEHKYQLEDLIFDLTEIPASDILAHVDPSKKDIYQVLYQPGSFSAFPLDTKWNNLIKIAVQNRRQSDIETLCLAVDGIEWDYKGKTVLSPLWLIPTTYKINKIKQEIQLISDFEAAVFNPFVKNELRRRYDLVWEEDEEEPLSNRSAAFYTFLKSHEFNFREASFCAFGHFHHHRFQIVRDLEALAQTTLNPLVNEMLGNADANMDEEKSAEKLTAQNLVPADKDQKLVFSKIEEGNLVIQGPPGTGKSQVLTNLLAKLLDQGKMSLVVSEKKSALEVLVKKLAVHRLDAFTFISHNQTKPADFISRLRKTWDLMETSGNRFEKNVMISEQLLSQLQLTLDKLVSKDLIGGIGLSQFRKEVENYDLTNIPYTSDVPSVADWLTEKEKVFQLAQQIGKIEKLRSFRQKALSDISKPDQVIAQLHAEFLDLTYRLDFQTFAELENRIKQTARCQILENESYKKYNRIFSNAKDRKKFEKLRMALIRNKEAFVLLAGEAGNWSEKPSLSQAQSWKIQLAKSWWKKRQAERQIKNKLLSNTILPEVAVDNWLRYLESEAVLQQTISGLQELGVERPEIEHESIHYLLDQLDQETDNELNQVAVLPVSLRKALIESGDRLQHLYRTLKNVINYDLKDSILETLDHALVILPEILPVQQIVQGFSPQIYRLLQQNDSIESVEKIILKSNWVQFESRFPELAKFDGSTLKSTITRIIETESEENFVFGRNLVYQQQSKFNAFHQLLRTPAAKLKPLEKAQKAVLKAGKAILVKEFAKTKQFKTIRELLDSEARPWIEILTPVWLSTSTQVAVSFPMEKSLFEFVIFDEASQIPLSHALGSMQRANRAVVAGDEQQMSPGNYFSGITASVDLLHHASYHWPRSPLKHHYRSMHPELIAFSNRFFYGNELIAYPSANRLELPLKFHFVADGIYEGRQNIAEAKYVAVQILKLLAKEDSLGIVAFSEQQLDCIWKQLSTQAQNDLAQRIEEGTAFFKALEQVQGDECDHLVISLGYGKDASGEFHMRFGPLNQKNGSKRLNVLLSRSKKSIDFYHSVNHYDLSVSSNEAVNLLRLFLAQSDDTQEQSEVLFPYGLEPKIHGNILAFEDITEYLADAEELVVLQSVLENRGWELRY